MHYEKYKISTGYAVNAAFMNYVEAETVLEILRDSQKYNAFEEEYNKIYAQLERMLGESFTMVDSLLNSLRTMHDLESELFYRIGMHDGITICNGNFVFQNIGGAN